MGKMSRKVVALLLVVWMAVPWSDLSAMAASTEEKTYKGEGYEIIYKVDGHWDGGNVTVEVKNTGTVDIENWAVRSSAPVEVKNLYNAEYISNEFDGTIFKNKGHNAVIRPSGIVMFGFSFSGNGVVPEEMDLCQKRIDMGEDVEAGLVVENSWGSGFTGHVNLTNKTEEDVEFFEVDVLTNFKICAKAK